MRSARADEAGLDAEPGKQRARTARIRSRPHLTVKLCAPQEGPVNTCSGGDVFQVIALRIADFFIRGIESIINKFIINTINSVFGVFGTIDHICIEDKNIKKYCPNEAELMEGWLGCDVNGDGPDHEKCYYLRQRAICMTDGDRYTRYKALFEQDSVSDLHEQFKSIAGEAYEDVPPTMLAAFEGASAQAEAATSHSTGLPLQEEQVAKICDSTLTDALTLDELIQAPERPLGRARPQRIEPPPPTPGRSASSPSSRTTAPAATATSTRATSRPSSARSIGSCPKSSTTGRRRRRRRRPRPPAPTPTSSSPTPRASSWCARRCSSSGPRCPML